MFKKTPSIRKKKVFGVNQNYKCCSQWWVILGWVRVSYKGKSAIKEAGKPALVWLFQHKEDKSSVPTLHVHQSRKTAKWFNISGDMSVERKTASAECKQNQQRGRADARWNSPTRDAIYRASVGCQTPWIGMTIIIITWPCWSFRQYLHGLSAFYTSQAAGSDFSRVAELLGEHTVKS